MGWRRQRLGPPWREQAGSDLAAQAVAAALGGADRRVRHDGEAAGCPLLGESDDLADRLGCRWGRRAGAIDEDEDGERVVVVVDVGGALEVDAAQLPRVAALVDAFRREAQDRTDKAAAA